MKTIYYGGTILTMEGTTCNAVCVEGGRISRLITGTIPFREQGTQYIDLQGNTMLPGFIDPHSHITAAAATLGLARLEGSTSFEELIKRLQAFQDTMQIKKGEWINGFAYDHNLLREGRHPDRTVLDKAFPDNPVLISHRSGHSGVMNSLALAEMGITKATPSPEGGRIAKDENGEPTGYLEEKAFTSLASKMPPVPVQQQMKQLKKAEELYFSYGITTIQDGLTRQADWDLLKQASEQGVLTADIVCYPDMQQNGEILQNNPAYRQYNRHLRIGGYKILLDGSPQGRTAWMTQPYTGEQEGYLGYPVYKDEQVRAFLQQAVTENVQILAHCNGDAAADQYITQYAKVMDTEKDSRPVMIHAQLVREDQLGKMAELGMIPSFFISHIWYWGTVHRKNFGLQRADFISPAKAAEQGGLCYTFHQDTPVVPPDMLFTIWCAVNRINQAGDIMGPEQCLDVHSALKAVTSNAAYQYFEEQDKGSIAVGKKADFVILDKNPLTVEKGQLKDIQVIRTIKDGVLVFER